MRAHIHDTKILPLQAVTQLVDACSERLTGDVSLKRAESMAMRPGGPLPKCLYNVKEDPSCTSVTESMTVTLQCDIDEGVVRDNTSLDVMSLYIYYYT